jgi:hypothetical protein
MRHTDTAGLLLSSVTAAYLTTHSTVVAGTVALAVVFLTITDDDHGSLPHQRCRCIVDTEEERS